MCCIFVCLLQTPAQIPALPVCLRIHVCVCPRGEALFMRILAALSHTVSTWFYCVWTVYDTFEKSEETRINKSKQKVNDLNV